MLLLYTLVLFTLHFTPKVMGKIPNPGCQTQCGNLTVQYPFGLDKSCSRDASFELTCNMTFNPPKLFIGSGNTQIYSMSDHEMKVFNSIAYKCYNESGNETGEGRAFTDLENTPFTFSQKNKLTVVGCDHLGSISTRRGKVSSACAALCSNASDVSNGECSGGGCCQTAIRKGLKYYAAMVSSVATDKAIQSFNPCGLAFLGEEGGFHFGGVPDVSNRDLHIKIDNSLPIVVDWVIGGNGSCTQAATVCKGNSSCNDADIGGYRCTCKQGYDGNPYLDPGCKDINECEEKKQVPLLWELH